MDKHKYITAKLEARPHEWGAIAKASGVTRQTIANVMAGKNPTMATVDKLYDYLKTLRKGSAK